MRESINILIVLFFAILLPFVGLIFGNINEKNHYRFIVAREKQYRHILIFNEKIPPPSVSRQSFYLVNGSVVMSSNWFKQVMATLKKIIGGRLISYESMLDRGRREAILRMKEQADEKGATMIFNVHLQTSVLNDTNSYNQAQLTCAEILAYGTAWVVPRYR